MKKEKPFKLESDLCAAFIAALPNTWTAYPETAGWDILLVRKADGLQIGIQAKLKLNANVLTQALEDHQGHWGRHQGADHRAVLVPPGEEGWKAICTYIGISVISLTDTRWDSYRDREGPVKWRITPRLPGSVHWSEDDWHDWCPLARHPLPEYVPDVTAGSASPIQLTGWKIKAIKVCILMERNGHLTRADFKHIGMDHRRWIAKDYGWLTIAASKTYIRGPHFPDLRQQHPRNWEEIAADFDKWAPKKELVLA